MCCFQVPGGAAALAMVETAQWSKNSAHGLEAKEEEAPPPQSLPGLTPNDLRPSFEALPPKKALPPPNTMAFGDIQHLNYSIHLDIQLVCAQFFKVIIIIILMCLSVSPKRSRVHQLLGWLLY